MSTSSPAAASPLQADETAVPVPNVPSPTGMDNYHAFGGDDEEEIEVPHEQNRSLHTSGIDDHPAAPGTESGRSGSPRPPIGIRRRAPGSAGEQYVADPASGAAGPPLVLSSTEAELVQSIGPGFNSTDGSPATAASSSMKQQKSVHGFVVDESADRADLFESGEHSSVGDDDDEELKKKNLREIYAEITAREFSPRQRFFHIIHGTPVLTPDDVISAGFNMFIMLMVLGSTVTFVAETLPEYYEPKGPTGIFFTLETIWVAVFTFDLLVRVVSATSPRNVFNIQMLFDFLSVIGYYIALGVDTSDSAESFQILRMLRLSRVARMSKLSRSGLGFQMMSKTIRKSKQGMLLLVLLVAIAMVLGAAVMYTVEVETGVWDEEEQKWYFEDGEESPFQSIPHTFWFVLLTLTTVGYGDAVPSAGYGRFVGVAIMVCGVLLLSFPNILIGANFQTVHDSWQRQRARNALGRRFRFVRYAVRFVRMWREFRKHGQMKLLNGSSYNLQASFQPRTSMAMEDTVASGPSSPANLRKLGTNLMRRTINFFFRSVDFAEFDYGVTFNELSLGNLDSFAIRGLTATGMLQRLVSIFSCCCTIEEMYESLLVMGCGEGSVKQCDLVELSCHLANAGILELYVLNRFDDHMLMMITKKGLRYLQHFEERDVFECMRCFNEACDVWKQTTGQETQVVLPLDGFRRWQDIQPTVAKRTKPSFVYDLKDPASKVNQVFRRVATRAPPPSAFGRGSSDMFAGGVRRRSRAETLSSGSFSMNGCKACVHCHARTHDSMNDEATLVEYEAMLMLQRRLIEQQLEIVSLRREKLRNASDERAGASLPVPHGLPRVPSAPTEHERSPSPNVTSSSRPKADQLALKDADASPVQLRQGTLPPGEVPATESARERASTYHTTGSGDSDEQRTAVVRTDGGASSRRHSWDRDDGNSSHRST